MSRATAEYPSEMCQAIAAIISPLCFLPSDRFWILHRLKPLSQSNNWENCQSAMRMEAAFTPNQIGADHFDLFLILS